ncbi:MAG: DUF308 domain-containing protein [Clostridia bacterium]|jgi:uncharacterized membrane protein HdeD (DUF308 family)|nr:DUF308 domain-containing protein [Clostridia bacterium]
MIERVKNYEKASIATSILLIILAFFLIFKPEASLNFIVIVIGAFLALLGIIHMVSYFTSNIENKTISTELIQGTIYTIIGLFLIFRPSILNEFLGVIIGAWQIIQFIVKFQFAFNLKSASSPTWVLMLVTALVHLVFGLVLIINPFATLATITMVTGIILLITEIGNMVESVTMLFKLS